MANEGLKELYIDELKDLYNAENQLLKALPKMAKAASSEELRQGFNEHLEADPRTCRTPRAHLQVLGYQSQGEECMGMVGLVKEGSDVMGEDFDHAVMDAALIGAAQRVEHYEIAAYGTVSEFAKILGKAQHVSLLQETLEEEKETDEKLTDLAKEINSQANEGTEQEGSRPNGNRRTKRTARN